MRELPILETERLIVRPFRLDDLDTVHRLFDKEIYPPGWPLEVRREWLQWSALNPRSLALLAQPPYGDRAVTLKDGTLIGSVGVVPYLIPMGILLSFGGDRDAMAQAEVGLFWAISPAYQRNGYATEAAQALINHLFKVERLGRVIADTDYDNQASQAVMRKLGMRLDKNPFPNPVWLQVVGILENKHKTTEH